MKKILVCFVFATIVCGCGQQNATEAESNINKGSEKNGETLAINTTDVDSAINKNSEKNTESLTTLTAPEIPEGVVKFDKTVPEEKRQEIMEKISKKYLMGQFDPVKDERFTKILSPYGSKSNMYMRKEAFEQFKAMHKAAKKDGITLVIKSATRPFNAQKSIWEAKWTGRRKVDGKLLDPKVKDPEARALKILRWSSMPSTSRHHWGTDIDINSFNPEYFDRSPGKQEYQWLIENAPSFGFCQVYSEMGEERPFGYQEEKWHWSYLPISQQLTRAYGEQIQDKDITGFLGAETAVSIDIVNKYVLGINPSCK
ncbi:MAG: M15 family metallopeptidase [Saprospiraceae bacterium]|nr:M15 family metallopeptidase [Saprospiraceae bacterium]